MLEVSFNEDAAVVFDVAGDDEGDGAGGDGMAAGGAGAGPGFWGKSAEQEFSGGANGTELVDVSRPGGEVSVGACGELILIEAWEMRFAAASDPELGSVRQ